LENNSQPVLVICGVIAVKQTFTVSVTREDDWYIARSLDVEIASQGKTEEEALLNLREALELYFSPPSAGEVPALRQVEVEIGAP
jgi:hypothetical protein